jgi:sigma-E factor negative regulatory protein RseA
MVDGELEQSRLNDVLRELRDARKREDWDCYHLIGDCLRHPDTARLPASFANGVFMERVSAALAEEPTVLAPQPLRREQPAFTAWAIAATIAAVGFVGWFAVQERSPGERPSIARMVDDARDAQIQRVSNVSDYVTVHQQYAPTMSIGYARPYIRSVSQDASQ